MRHRNVVLALFAALISTSGCGDGDLFSPGKRGNAQLTLRPSFSSGMSFAADINLIRVTVREIGSGRVVLEKEFSVNPADNEWDLNLEVPPNSNLEIVFLLINKTAGGQETIEFSGKIEITVTTGDQPPPPPVPLAPGPPENLSITGISISPRPTTLLEGATVDLNATTIGGPPNPTIVWSSLNAAVATVDQQGNVTARAPGQATILAFAGLFTDNITINVLARATRVAITPADPLLTSFGADAALTGRVVDARGNEVPGFSVSWSTSDATIADQVSPGVFRARRNGTTTITATGTGPAGETVTGSTTLKVDQRAATLTVDPASITLSSVGATRTLVVTARDATGNVITGLTATFTSGNTAIATVDANGVVTARAAGETTITVAVAGATADVLVKVQPAPASIVVTPAEKTLESINESVQLTAVVRDANGNVLNVPVTWSSTLSFVAGVDGNGLVTAAGDGTTTVVAQVGTTRGSAIINVDRVPRSIRLNTTSVDLDAGDTFQLTATVADANGFAISGHTVTWSSAQPSIASVSSTGLVTGLSEGSTTITATGAGFQANAAVNVTGTSVEPPPTGDVLIISNASSDNTHIITNLSPLMPGVTFAQTTNPAVLTPSFLAGFKAVLLFENGIHGNATAFGNAIAGYVLNGGNVVIGTFYWQGRSDNPYYASFSSSYGALEALDVFEAPPGMSANDFYNKYEYRQAILDPASIVAHPLTQGVSSLNVPSYPNGMEAKSVTTVVARYANGAPLIGFRVHPQGQRFVGVAVWPAHGGVTGDFWQIWVNAINFARAGSTPTVPGNNILNKLVAPNAVVAPDSNVPSGIGGSRGSRDPIAPAKKVSQPKPR